MKLETHVKYLRRLKKSGVKVMGSGAFATVFQHPSHRGVVVRYTEEPDHSYEKFIEHVIEAKNPWFPRVYDVQRVELRDSVATFTFMERLKKIGQLEEAKLARSFMKCLPKNFFDGYSFSGEEYEFIHDIEEDMWKSIAKRHPDHEFREAFKLIKHLVKKGGGEYDLHGANFMKRKDGHHVITDPIAFGFTDS